MAHYVQQLFDTFIFLVLSLDDNLWRVILAKINIDDIGLVILNYMTVDETKEMLKSVSMYYPELRVVVVDNGSVMERIIQLRDIVKLYPQYTLLENGANLGFAQGNNKGIDELRAEGFKYIVCSNNDVIFPRPGVLEKLKHACLENDAAVVGPRIVNLSGQEQNPYEYVRPSKAAARKCYRRACWVPDAAYPALSLWRYFRKSIKPQKKRKKNMSSDQPALVYGLHCSFIMFCPRFFEFYNGFDDNTFLYGEERIIAEMLFCKNLQALFVPSTHVIHKEDATSTFVWKSNAERMMYQYYKRSMRHWYKNHFRKNNP